MLRRLECLAGVTHHGFEENDRSICCVLLDVGWLKSQLGHHIARLCAILEVRLIVLRPMNALAKLVSTNLHPLKKVSCLSHFILFVAAVHFFSEWNKKIKIFNLLISFARRNISELSSVRIILTFNTCENSFAMCLTLSSKLCTLG